MVTTKPRLLILGASGFVGCHWARFAKPHFEVFQAARKTPQALNWLSVDITDRASVDAAFDAVRPQNVTLLAALSDIDRCQRVFDGICGYYREDDPPSPPNYYGETKARAERIVDDLAPDALILRLSLVLGTSTRGTGNSYLEKVVANLRAGNEIISPTYEYRNPLDAGTLAEFLLELSTNREARGIFHAGASDKISRFNLALAIARHLGADERLIVPQIEPVAGRAPRGRDDFLATDRLAATCQTPIPNCQQALARALAAVAR
jgi:dTDP-4-dehydrorhamnose reductase